MLKFQGFKISSRSKSIQKSIMLKKAINIFKTNKVHNIKISTSKNQEKAINMYLSYGAIKVHEDQNFNKNNKNVVFILNLKK